MWFIHTPDETAVESLVWPPTKTFCVLVKRKSEIYSKTFPLMPYDTNFMTKFLMWHLIESLGKV